MQPTAKPVPVDGILAWRDLYRQEMDCQIVHDSLHSRKGWTQEYLLDRDGVAVGYGSVAVGGPWKEKPALFEFYVLPYHRGRIFELFSSVLAASGVTRIEFQSNDALLLSMAHTFARDLASESILFHDKLTPAYLPFGAGFRHAAPNDAKVLLQHDLDSEASWVVTWEGAVAGAGDILYHYNRPYGDIYMKVAEAFRRRGLGAYLVQELKRVCYQGGSTPSARCNPANVASRKTLQNAGFVPCGHILAGSVSS